MATTHEDLKRMLEHIHAHLFHDEHGLAAILAGQRHLERRIKRIMAILDDIKTINAETKEKVINLGTKLDSALARIQGFKDAIAALNARIDQLIAQGGGAIDAAGAEELRASAQEIEDAADVDVAKADILANTEGDPTA